MIRAALLAGATVMLSALPAAAQSAAQTTAPADPHAAHDMAHMDHQPTQIPAEQPMAGMDMGGMAHAMTGALGPYAMTRDASGTAWQPDVSEHQGLHLMRGSWMFMAHATLNAVWDTQSGPRGDDKAFVAGMAMGEAQRSFTNGDALTLRAMLSPDPLMGPRGYPLLLATGETADGKTPLVDRQHPHDLFMELSATYAHKLAEGTSVFVYAGLPGEPAFGPPAFMHRLSIMDAPEAPISHHWLDSTHVSFGVLTAGAVLGDWKLEASRYNGREPDQHRWDIETGALDSTAARVSWNPDAHWSLQASWADEKSPEQLEPGINQRKWSASAIYTRRLGGSGWWSSTAAWGRRSSQGRDLDAWVLESAVRPGRDWTLFARAERVENDELTFAPGGAGPVFTVGKVSAGAVRDWPVSPHVSVGLGGLYALDFIPGALKALYGGDPHGAMVFTRLKLR